MINTVKSVNLRDESVGAGCEEEDDYLGDEDDDIYVSSAPFGPGIPQNLLSQPGEGHSLYLFSEFKDTELRDDRCVVDILLSFRVHEHSERIKFEV